MNKWACANNTPHNFSLLYSSQFSPWLKKFYETHAKASKLEIIYVSSDKTVPSFEDYYKTMPWLAVPSEKGSAAIKQQLANTFGIMGIPALMIMDAKTGEFISGSGREDVTNTNDDSAKGKAIIEQWKSAERKPLSEAAGAVGGSGGWVMKVIMYFARNPMFLFGLLYFYKWGKQKFVGEGQELWDYLLSTSIPTFSNRNMLDDVL